MNRRRVVVAACALLVVGVGGLSACSSDDSEARGLAGDPLQMHSCVVNNTADELEVGIGDAAPARVSPGQSTCGDSELSASSATPVIVMTSRGNATTIELMHPKPTSAPMSVMVTSDSAGAGVISLGPGMSVPVQGVNGVTVARQDANGKLNASIVFGPDFR